MLFSLAVEGVVEIWLTSEDTGAYGRDIGVTLPQLLWKLMEVIPEGCMLRLGMTNPPYILEHLEVFCTFFLFVYERKYNLIEHLQISYHHGGGHFYSFS